MERRTKGWILVSGGLLAAGALAASCVNRADQKLGDQAASGALKASA